MRSKLLPLLIGGLCSSLWAAVDIQQAALKMVPDGKVVSSDKDEVKVRSAEGGVVEVEFNRKGELDEASGDNALADQFVPGNELLSLKDAVASLQKQGKQPNGEWQLDNDLLRGWEYEFEGYENQEEYEYTLNAKTGELVKSEAD